MFKLKKARFEKSLINLNVLFELSFVEIVAGSFNRDAFVVDVLCFAWLHLDVQSGLSYRQLQDLLSLQMHTDPKQRGGGQVGGFRISKTIDRSFLPATNLRVKMPYSNNGSIDYDLRCQPFITFKSFFNDKLGYPP
jgi:hypothetical protein